MKGKCNIRIFSILGILILGLSACSKKPDPELNMEYYKNYSYLNNGCYWYYENKFQDLQIDVVGLRLGLDLFVISYDDVYTGKEDYFYSSVFEDVFLDIYTSDLVKLYNNNPKEYYYLKPYLDCYLLMDKNKKPSDEDLETIKETILYALEYYINGRDFVGTLE